VQQELLQAAVRPKSEGQRPPPVGELISSIDWSNTSFGPLETWPANLRDALDACLIARVPIALFLGPDLALIYNELHGSLIADKHPASLGAKPADVYPEIWRAIEPLLRRVVETGEDVQSGDLALDIRRNGKREERHVSFSFSPMESFGGRAGDVLGIATETTERVIAARRQGVLAGLATRFLAPTTAYEACRIGVEVLGADMTDIAFAAIYVLEGQEQLARLVVAAGIGAHDAGLWPLAEAARHDSPLGVEGLMHSADRLNLPTADTPDQAVLVPLTPVGAAGPPTVLVVGVNRWRPYDERYRDFMRLAGGQIGAAVNQARFREEERRATKREGALRAEAALVARRLATVLGSISDTYESFDREWRYISVNRRSIELMSLRVEDIIGRRLWDLFPDLVDTPFYDAARRAVEENIITRVEYAYPIGSDRWLEARFHPSADGVTLVTTQISERKRAEAALHTRARQQEAVVQLGREALLGNDLGMLMDLAAAVVADTLGDALSVILEFLPERSQLRLRAGVGWRPGLVGRTVVEGDADALFGHALTSASPLVIEDIANRAGLRIPPVLIDHNVVTSMSIVIGALDGGAWGLLGVQTTTRRRFTAEDVNFMQAVAHVLAAAIHRETVTEALACERTTLEDRVAQRTRALASANKLLKRLSARLMETQEGERRRIARELHDQTGQALTALKMNLESIRPSSADDPTGFKVLESVDIVDSLLEQVRNLALDLHPAVLDDLGLPAALRCYARRLAQRGALELDLGVADLPERLPPAIETTCFRVAQEALTNVARHARARRVLVELRCDGWTAHLLVRDDGIGFDSAAGPADGPADRHLGLLSMRERVALAGGQIVIASKSGTGTEIAASFPLHHAANGEK